jgi:hypothetical protein
MATLMEVKADSRGRVALGPEVRNKRYLVQQGGGGELILVPAVSIPERERALYRDFSNDEIDAFVRDDQVSGKLVEKVNRILGK